MWYTLTRYFILWCGFSCVLGLAFLDQLALRVVGLFLINLGLYPVGIHLLYQQRNQRYHALCHHASLPARPLGSLPWRIRAGAMAFTLLWVSIGIWMLLLTSCEQRIIGLLIETLSAPVAIHGMAFIACRDAFTHALQATPPGMPPTTPTETLPLHRN